MNYTTENFIKWCDEMTIVDEGFISDAIKRRQERKQKNREENKQRRKELIEEYKKLEKEYKPILMKIARDFIQEFNRNSIRYVHCSTKMDNDIEYYEDVDNGDTHIEADIAYTTETVSSRNADDDHFECLKKSKDNIMKKYKKEFEMYNIDFDGNSCNIFIIMELTPPKVAKESFIECVTESAKDMKTVWEDTDKKMNDLRHKINEEEDVATAKKMLSDYIDLVNKLKSEIESLDYSSIDNVKHKIHKVLATAVPLLTFIGTFAGITILNKKSKEVIGEKPIGGIAKFTVSAIAGGAAALKVGSPKDIKKYYLNEIEYLIKEIKLQQKLMDALLSKGIRTMSEADNYDIEFTSNSINITKK
jgi:hypothetical protein